MQPVSGQQASSARRTVDPLRENEDQESLAGGRRLACAELRWHFHGSAAPLGDHGRRRAVRISNATNSIRGPIPQLALRLLGCRTMWSALVTFRRITEFPKLAKSGVFLYDARRPGEFGREISEQLPAVPVRCLGSDGALSVLAVPLSLRRVRLDATVRQA